MTARSRGSAAPELVLWISAGLLALGAHVGGAVWLLRKPPLSPADDRPPAAIMIELAELPEAVSTEQNELSPDPETAEASRPAQKVEAPREKPPEEVPEPAGETAEAAPEEPRPVETPAPPDEVDEPVEEETPVLDKVEVPLPAARPTPPERKKAAREEKTKPASRPQQPRAASRQALQAQAQATPSSRNAARQSASGTASAMTPATWRARLMAHLERRKTYPPGSRARGERGTVLVRFSIDEAGNVLAVALARSSGFPDLDREVLALVRRASPVPAPPPGANTTITAPVRFNPR